MAEACRDTNASLKRLDNQVRQPPDHMLTVKGNIAKFNTHVNTITEEMNARSHVNSELPLTQKNAPDESFQHHIEGKENDCDDGKDITAA